MTTLTLPPEHEHHVWLGVRLASCDTCYPPAFRWYELAVAHRLPAYVVGGVPSTIPRASGPRDSLPERVPGAREAVDTSIPVVRAIA